MDWKGISRSGMSSQRKWKSDGWTGGGEKFVGDSQDSGRSQNSDDEFSFANARM